MDVTIGRIVHYTLAAGDADQIKIARQDSGGSGNQVAEGDVYPAMVVRTFGGPATANLQVHLDGTDTFWATSRMEGNGPGSWAWPLTGAQRTGRVDVKQTSTAGG